MKAATPVRHPPALAASRRFSALPTRAQVYIAGVIVSGVAIVGGAVADFPADQLPLFVVLLLVSGVTSAVKVSLPVAGSASTLSFAYVVNFVALLSLGPVAIVPVAVTSAWSQCTFGGRRRSPPHQTLFSMAALAVTVSAAGWAYVGIVTNMPRSGQAGVGASLVSATVYFLLNTLLVAAVIALTSGKRITGVWMRDFLWSGPTYYIGALIAVLAFTAASQGSLLWAAVLLTPAFVSYRSYRAYLERITEEQANAKETADLQITVVETLAQAIEARDHSSQHHLARMQVYTEGLARELGLPENQIRGVRTAALLHDIGTLAVPEHILAKPGLLTTSEIERMRIHARVGADILTPVPFPYPVAPLVLAHHERWDGRGYPGGVAGDQIPIGARILAVADCFTTMLADRPHRKAGSLADAIAAVRENSGSALDAAIVETLLRILPRLEAEATGSRAFDAVTGEVAEREPAAVALTDIAVAHHEEQMLFQIAQALGATLRAGDVGALISTHLARLLPFTSSAVFVWDEASRSYSCEHAIGNHADVMRALTAPSLAELEAALASLVILRGAGTPEPAQSRLVAPIESDGSPIGALVFCHEEEHVYTSDHGRLVARVAAQSAPVVANAMLLSRAHQQSLTDPLTGLANRTFVERQLERELSRAQRLGHQLSVLFFDVDQFKGINDLFGHQAGDEALLDIGGFLQSGLRNCDVCARYGGDEFVVLLFDCDGPNAEVRLRSLQGGVAELVLGPSPGRQVMLVLSGGAATYPVDGANAKALIAAAERRMCEDKLARRRDTDAAAPES